MNKRPTQESLDLANKFICEMEGGAPNLTSTDFSNAKKLAALLDSIRLEEAKGDNSFDLEKAAKNLHDLQKVGAVMGLHGPEFKQAGPVVWSVLDSDNYECGGISSLHWSKEGAMTRAHELVEKEDKIALASTGKRMQLTGPMKWTWEHRTIEVEQAEVRP